MTAVRTVLVLTVLALSALSERGLPARGVQDSTGGSTRVISATVVAMWQAHSVPTTGAVLDFLVLWRGSPGWAIQSSGTGSVYLDKATGEQTRVRSYGKHELSAIFNPRLRTLRLRGLNVALGDSNVVLVDHADRPTETKVVRTLKIDGKMPQGISSLEPVVRQSRILSEYLQCGVRLPDPSLQLGIDRVCESFLSQATQDARKGIDLAALPAREAKSALTSGAVVVIPFSPALRNHREGIPTSIDARISGQLAQHLLGRRYVLLAPAIEYWPERMFDLGLLDPSDVGMVQLLGTCRALGNYGAKRFYVVALTDGADEALAAAERILQAEGLLVRFFDPLNFLSARETPKTTSSRAHGGDDELSIMLALNPTRIDMASLTKNLGTARARTLREHGVKLVDAILARMTEEVDSLRAIPIAR